MAINIKRTYRFFIRAFFILTPAFLGLALFFYLTVRIPSPEVGDLTDPDAYRRVEVSKDFYKLDNNWLRKNEHGIWEMYIEGDAFERGLIYGKLARELMEKQEIHFVAQINEIIPNAFYRFLLKLFVAWFNRDLHEYIPGEFKQEIYGISLSFSDKYNYIGPKYHRILNYHAAHDIGHALNDFNMVGCTSFAVNKEFSTDSSLLIARNFDFYMGEGFAEDKLLVFVNPRQGYKYTSYSWAGFAGVVSGMNEKGLTVTINAAKSDIPRSAKTPVSILAREILQYAKNIDEAVAIARKRATFVSESLLIGSAEDDKAVIIEKSTKNIAVFDPVENAIPCTNHYQSDFFLQDQANIENIRLSDSRYRMDRLRELLSAYTPVDVPEAVQILRNKEGLNGKTLGYGNPKAINQLIAHHGIVFKPEQRRVWVSTPPYQLGAFICYSLDTVFEGNPVSGIDSLMIREDAFVRSEGFAKYRHYLEVKEQIFRFTALDIPFSMTEEEISFFIQSNPDNYQTYMLVGDYYLKSNEAAKARDYYRQSLCYEVASQLEEQKIYDKIKRAEEKAGED